MNVSDTQTILDLAGQVKRRKRSALEIARESLDRIAQLDPLLHAFHEVYAEEAIAAARRVDEKVAAGEDPGQLVGVPIALKDNIVTEFGHTTCGSRILENFRSPYSATA